MLTNDALSDVHIIMWYVISTRWLCHSAIRTDGTTWTQGERDDRDGMVRRAMYRSYLVMRYIGPAFRNSSMLNDNRDFGYFSIIDITTKL